MMVLLNWNVIALTLFYIKFFSLELPRFSIFLYIVRLISIIFFYLTYKALLDKGRLLLPPQHPALQPVFSKVHKTRERIVFTVPDKCIKFSSLDNLFFQFNAYVNE